MRQLIKAELDFIKVSPSLPRMCREIPTGDTHGSRQRHGNERERDGGAMCVREAMRLRERQGQCVCEREAGEMRERETQGHGVTDLDVYTPLTTDVSHEHQEQIMYTYRYRCSWLETG
jgi:hypothetical protein